MNQTAGDDNNINNDKEKKLKKIFQRGGARSTVEGDLEGYRNTILRRK